MSVLHYYVVDRVHDDNAVVVDDMGRAVTVPAVLLPERIVEGSVLRVPVTGEAEAQWSRARIDDEEVDRRRRRSAEFAEQLRHSDEHGFITQP